MVPREVEVRGGTSEADADLSGVGLSHSVLKGGISDLDLTLPEPSRVIPIRLSGGASKVGIRRHAGVEARVSMKGAPAS